MADFIRKNKYMLLLLASVTVIFVCLYHKMLWGGFTYMYADIGSDTINDMYPKYMLKDYIKSGILSSGYSFQNGLGGFVLGPYLSYLDPLDWIYLLMPGEYIYYANVIALFVRVITMAVFSYLFFKRIYRNQISAFLSSLIWVFCGYTVLWGQHYSFATGMAYFTMILYFLQMFIENDKKKKFLPLALAFCAYDNYYFFYMAGIFCVIYILYYSIIKKWGIKGCLKKELKLFLMALVAIGISAAALFPTLREFLLSVRGGELSLSDTLGVLYSPMYLLTYAGRFMSNNILGIGENFSGAYNYYEAGVLATSLLFPYSLVMLFQGKRKKRAGIIFLISAAALVMPITSLIMNMNALKPRWTFILSLLMVICIGFFVDILVNREIEASQLKKTVIIANIAYGILFFVLFLAHKKNMIVLNKTVCIFILTCITVYSIVLWNYQKFPSKGIYFLTVMIMAELVLTSYPTVNERKMISIEELNHGFYEDGTKEIVKKIKENDSSFYRVNKTYDSVFYNDALVQGYNGTAFYGNSNSKELINFYTSLDLSLLYGKTHFIRIPYTREYLNSLLGVKYLIARKGEPVQGSYREFYSDEQFTVYKNEAFLPFGYLYENEIGKNEFNNLKGIEKDVALTKYYYFTEEVDESALGPKLDEISTYDLIPLLKKTENCTAIEENAGLQISGMENDMQLTFDIPKLEEYQQPCQLKFTLTADQYTIAKVHVSTREAEENTINIGIASGTNVYYIDLENYKNIQSIRMNISEINQEIKMSQLVLETFDIDKMHQNIEKMQRTSAIRQEENGNSLSGTVENLYQREAMLCMPVIYDDNWKAYVDGKKQEVCNINGGLLGVSGIAAGRHEIRLVYSPVEVIAGCGVSAVVSIIYLIAIVASYRRKKK